MSSRSSTLRRRLQSRIRCLILIFSANVVPFHRLSADAFNRGRAADGQPQRLARRDSGWVVIADPDMPGGFVPGAELLDLRQATSEREAVLAALRYCDDTCRNGPDPALGDRMLAAAAAAEADAANGTALRRLVRLLAPGISPDHQD